MPNFRRVPLPGEQSNPGSREYIYRFPDSRTVFWSNPENTLPDPVSRRGCAMTVKKCTKKHDAHAKLTILLITAYLLFAILVDIFFDAYAHLKMFKPLELFGILHIQLWAKS